jgi:N-acyl homoserine lactone hydrolase
MRAGLWLRSTLILFAAVPVVLSATLYFVYFHRAALPSAPPQVRIVPSFSPVRGLSACWIETGSTFTSFPFAMTAGSILVKHPQGSVLIDTGNSSRFDDEVNVYPFALRLKLKALVAQLDPAVPLPWLLHLLGEDPGKIRWVILSHVHLDHAGGLMDLPQLPVLLTKEELQFAYDRDAQAKGYVLAAYSQKFPPADAPTLKFDPRPYETFDESVDLYGDGSVVVVPLRGHTPGSVGIFVNLNQRRRLFYVGDAVDDERGFVDRVGKPLLLRDSDNDAQRANEIVAKLNQLHAEAPEISIIPAHGRNAYLRVFPGGPLSCVPIDSSR